ncbi:hypothetical protein Thiowin_00184 [Thiorhodovibrio winogradskyi]|uniref:Uncharacterized protein n=1 Tax=Thiorhodovibrio winogradskyi TaxID=77007 RepID=A0ABZ0S4K6_9GAMM
MTYTTNPFSKAEILRGALEAFREAQAEDLLEPVTH